MTETPGTDTRQRLLSAAADLIAASPGEDFSLRAVCSAVGVKMPTLYHFFGSKQGLIDAVVERGFELYVGEKASHGSSGDPIQDLRRGWDAHVAFGLANPGFYTLMYGTVQPGHVPAAQEGPSAMLRELTDEAQSQGRLVVPSAQAAAHVLSTNIGVTLRQIILGVEDRALSDAVREGVLAAITGTGPSSDGVRAGEAGRDAGERGGVNGADVAAIHRTLERAAAHPGVLGVAETALLTQWLRRLAGLV
ncbi:TetR/AcrR family transcriptional regulator [Brachybacterium sp. AOP25-B2-12]|uniref:TetR/AcrR family transcriptional regulator n=1 Tax=Brachybacterium sp. AOP25-B2-12 TaxID=3457710 RepID=UPI004033978E